MKKKDWFSIRAEPKDGETMLFIAASFEGGRCDFEREAVEIMECIRQYGCVEQAILDTPPMKRNRRDVTDLY